MRRGEEEEAGAKEKEKRERGRGRREGWYRKTPIVGFFGWDNHCGLEYLYPIASDFKETT